jgi:hypothetical protein
MVGFARRSAAASNEPADGRREDPERWARVDGEYADQRRPTPVRPIAVRIVDVDDQRLGHTPHNQVDRKDQSDADEDSPFNSSLPRRGQRRSSHSLKGSAHPGYPVDLLLEPRPQMPTVAARPRR